MAGPAWCEAMGSRTWARRVRRQSCHFEHDRPRFDDGHPMIRLSLSLAHSRFERTGRDGLVRKNADIELPVAANVLHGGDTAGLDRRGLDVPRLQRLQS